MILLCRKDIYRQIRKSIDNNRLDYFKRELKAVLKKQLDGESNEVEKSFSQRIDEILKGYDRAHLVPKQVRAVNEKTGKSYMKTVYINPNKQYGLKKYHETDSKGSKIAIAKLMKSVDKCQSEEELYKLVLRNKGRFSDSEGKPLPIVAELRKYIDEKQKNIGNSKPLNKKESYTGKLRQNLKNNLKGSFGLHTNKKTGIEANLSGNSVNKMGSEKAIEKSKANGFSVEDHFEVANKIVKLFENATLVETSDDKKKSPGIKSIKRFDSDVVLKNGKMATAHITVKESVVEGHKIYSVEVMELTQKNTASKEPAVGGKVQETLASKENIPQSDNSVKENNNETEKRAAELKSHIGSVFDEYMNDPYTRHTAESSIKKYGKKKLEELAKMDLETDEEYKKNLFDKVASVEKEENREISESAIDIAIWKQCVSVFMQKLAREKLKSMAENENMIDVPISDSDMDEAIGIIGSDVTRILDGRDAFGNTKQGLVDKIKRRVRNSPGVARAMLVYIKREQEKTGKKVFTEKHSIWELLPKLNEQAAQAYEKGESETKKGVSGNLYEGEDGTTVVENKDWGRYQISFPGKPDYETISTLKRNGFRWSPKTQSWVCYNTANGERSLKQVAEKLGLKKTEIKKSSLESYVEKSIRILKMAGAV